MPEKLTLTPEAQRKAEAQYQLAAKTYEAVGRGISTWAAMEMRLVQITARLLGTAERKAGLILYSINNFYSWITIIDGLFGEDEGFPESKRKRSALVSDLKKQNDVRVRLAHQSLYLDVYVSSDEGALAFVPGGLKPAPFDARPKQKTVKLLSLPEITTFTKAVEALYDKLAKIVVAMDGPETSR